VDGYSKTLNHGKIFEQCKKQPTENPKNTKTEIQPEGAQIFTFTLPGGDSPLSFPVCNATDDRLEFANFSDHARNTSAWRY